MKLIQKSTTQQELLDNTINHFNINNRATTEKGHSMYRCNNIGCAIGREISNKLAKSLQSEIFSFPVVQDEVFYKLPKRLQKLDRIFLMWIQVLHDSKENWNEEGLSAIGISKVKAICIKYNLKFNYKNQKV